MSRHAKIGRHYHGKWGLPCKKTQFLYDFQPRAEAHMSRHAKIGRRYHSKLGSPCKNPQFLHDFENSK